MSLAMFVLLVNVAILIVLFASSEAVLIAVYLVIGSAAFAMGVASGPRIIQNWVVLFGIAVLIVCFWLGRFWWLSYNQ